MAPTTVAEALEPALRPITDTAKTEAIVKAVVRAAAAWRLTNQEAADLFDVPLATWNRMKSNTFKGRLDQDKVTRASVIIRLF